MQVGKIDKGIQAVWIKTSLMHNLRKKLHEIAPLIFDGTPTLFAYLYGSHAKGLTHPFSDLDIGIFVEHSALKDCLKLELSLSLRVDELLGHVVQSDVRVINHMPLLIVGSMLVDGEIIYSRAENERIDVETQVRKAYFDFMPVIHNYRKTYLD
jgi:predicted nucleotidyltransferase